jgi:hypothetical protein
LSVERLEVRQFLEQVLAARPDLPDGLIERLLRLLEAERPDRVEDIKELFKEFARG